MRSKYVFDVCRLWDGTPYEIPPVNHTRKHLRNTPTSTVGREGILGVEDALPFEPRAPIEEQILRYAFAAVLLQLKDTPAATRRCRRRMERAIKATQHDVAPISAPFDDPRVPRAAAGWLRLVCRQCGKCAGAEEIKQPSVNGRPQAL